MASDRPNYCHLLGLNPLKEASYPVESILKKIATKREKWANDSRNKQNDTEQRFKAERLVEMTSDMERVMKDPILRRNEFEGGKTFLKGRVQKLRLDCIILTDGTYVALPGAADAYLKKLHWEGLTKPDILNLAGIKDGNPPKPASDKVLNAYKGLRAVDSHTPAEMLNALIRHPNLEINVDPLGEGSSFAQIRNAFDVCDKRVNNVRPEILPEQDSYIQTMRSLKLILEDDKELSNLIAYGKCSRALLPVMDAIEQEYTSQLSRSYIDELVNTHMSKDFDMALAMKILQQFCFKKKMAANFSNADTSMIRCPECANMVQAGPNVMFCPACGKNFKVICPACSTSQLSKNAVCIKCGFNFKEGTEKAQRAILDFRMSMKDGKIIRAERFLIQLRNTYPNHPELSGMENDMNRAKGEVASTRKLILEAHDRGRYTEAKIAGESLAKRYPDVLDNDIQLKQKFDDSMNRYNSAEIYCKRAAMKDTKVERMDCYVSAAEVCPDHPDARAKLRENPPSGPADGTGNITGRSFTIKFVPPNDRNGMTYCIFRSRNSLPNVTDDTTPLAEIPGNIYTDKTLDPGVEYYYSIHSKRWGILSKEAAHIGPVMIIAEVENVKIDPIDGGLRIMYEKPYGAKRVRLWRSDGNDNNEPTEIPLNGATVYNDLGLAGGKKYYYLFVTEYEGRNKIERSEGVTFSEATINAPKPVNDMKITWEKADGTYTARWSTKENVVLYSSPKKIAMSGSMVKMDDIRSWMTEIVPISRLTDGIRFSLPDGAVRFIYPIIPVGTIGIRGTDLLVANLRPFRDVEWCISNKDCLVTMAWPNDAIEAKLVISNGPTPRDITDNNAEIITVRREEYMEDREIRIPMGRSRRKFVNIYAIYPIETNLRASRPVLIEVNNGQSRKVRYTMKQERNMVAIDLSTEAGVNQLPPMMLVQTSKGIPLKRTDGEVVWRSNGPVSIQNGRSVISIQCNGLEDLKRTRLFLVNDSDYYDFRFVHPLYDRRD